MRRVALKVEYDGGGFFGWQRQAVGVSVQSVLETAAAKLTGLPITCVAAGRTDSGVHALAQVVHMDLPERFSTSTIQDAMNFHVKPHPVGVVDAAFVADTWSARFSAIGRAYRYDIRNRRARLVLDRGRAWLVEHPLDTAAMQHAAAILTGRHDFTSFRASSCQAKSPIRTLDRLEVIQDGEWIRIHAEARSFLHHQVRNMVGTLKLVGEGRWTLAQVTEALAARDRSAAGPTAPPDGLYFVSVTYPIDPFAP